MQIKEGALDALEEIAGIVAKYRAFYGVEKQDMGEVKGFLTERIQKEQSKIFLALEGGAVVGFVQLYPSYSTVSLRPQWILNDLYVLEEARCKGVATALMNAVKAYFKDSAKGFLLVTDKTNATAKRFYETCGWETGEHDLYTFFY
jgi:GNAT superfamily N-acetyltransferase